ncbi:MAG: tetratricopeptide repeat-containing sensor histidine kinase [Bergeyella sp.]
MKKTILFIFLLHLNVFIAQNKSNEEVVDSIFSALPKISSDKDFVLAYTKMAFEYSALDSDKGLFYGKKALDISKKINWNEGKSNALTALGENNFCQGKYSEAFQNYENALRYAKNKITIGRIYRNMAVLYNSQGDYEKSSKYAFDALKISEAEKNEAEKAKNYNAIGAVYFYTNQTRKALFYYNKSLEINTRLNQKREICKSLQNIGAAYEDIFDTKNAVNYFNKSLALAKEIDFKESIAVNNFFLGRLYLDEELFEKGLPYIITAKKYAEEIKNYRMFNSCLLLEANVYTKQADKVSEPEKTKLLNKAESKLLESIEKAKKSNSMVNLSTAYGRIAKLYSLKKDYKTAVEYQILYNEVKDSIYDSKSKETIKNLEDKRTIDLRNKEIQIHKIQLENKEKQKWYFISGISLLAIIGGMLFYQNRQRKKNNEKLSLLNTELDKANKNKMRFFGILNHDLRSPVASLVHFLHLQKNNPEFLDEQTKEKLNQQTTTSAERLLQQMEDLLLWSKSQMEKFEAEKKEFPVKELFSELQNEFVWVENTKIIFEDFADIKVFSDKEYLKTILRNLIGNAVKVLENKPEAKIICSAENAENSVKISVKDNGGGTEIEKFKALYSDTESIGIKQGLGLHVIRDLCKAINAEIEVKTDKEIGETEIDLFVAKGLG